MALNMLLAIWISGPGCMMLSSTFSGSGFANPDSLQALVFMTALFPITTFSMSAYTMALGALLIASAYLVVYILIGFAIGVKKPNTGNSHTPSFTPNNTQPQGSASPNRLEVGTSAQNLVE
jgi:hypothetical protein